MRKSRVTCDDLGITSLKQRICRVEKTVTGIAIRCINVPLNRCRMKPVDAETGKKLKRKFTVKKEGVTEVW